MTEFLRAESVAVDDDEGRFTLDIHVDQGYLVRVDIHEIDLDAFYDQVKGRIGPYLQERDDVKRAYDRGDWRSVFTCAPEDVDESSGYDRSDPKHPDWHSVHADLWDLKAGK